jgi:hypothetical protein
MRCLVKYLIGLWQLDFFVIHLLGYSLAQLKNVKIWKNFLVWWFMSLKERSLVLGVIKENVQKMTISVATNMSRRKVWKV